MDATRLIGLLAEPERLRVVAAMVLGAIHTDDIAAAAGLDLRATVDALDRLEGGGLVVGGDDGTWVLLEAAFKRAARRAATPRSTEHDDEPPEVRRVLDVHVRDGRLVSIPTKRSRRLVVLDIVAQRFEPGVRYTERQVNASLAAVHPDTAALRRHLVDEGFLARDHGEYWRTGGSVT